MIVNLSLLLINIVFAPIVREFEQDYGYKIHPLTKIEFNYDMPDNTLGVCYMGLHEIQINANLWDDMTKAEQKFVLYHELGHCELNRYHVRDDNSIMRPYVFNDYELEQFWYDPKPYLDELFGHQS